MAIERETQANPPSYQQGTDTYTHTTPGLIYIDTSFPGAGMDPGAVAEGVLGGCECPSVCQTSCHGSEIAYRENILSHIPPVKPVVECNDLCTCGSSCGNRVVQCGPACGLEVRSTPGKGLGLFTSHDLPKGAFVCEYSGEIISGPVAKARFDKQTAGAANYILTVTEYTKKGKMTTIIDPTVTGNLGRYANHSCSPNICIVPVRVEEVWPRAAFFTTRSVCAGEELCYHYAEGLGEAGRVTKRTREVGRGLDGLGEAGTSWDLLGEAGEGERGTGRGREGLGEVGMGREGLGDAGMGREGLGDAGRGRGRHGEMERRWGRDGETGRNVEGKFKLSSTPCLCGGKNCLGFLPAVEPEID
ncbi:histone-lysine N-methyltransferase SETMAR-like [Scylla paramamosain]|uniref:histone-lysine N-methyltransferase SETMAR-like n=1 Tax=Scylla paramamosain TaxID=85552 RepID=UPI003083AAAA